MNDEKARENLDYYHHYLPERKIELVDGRLFVGNGLAGSRLLLDHILRGWSLDAAVALCSSEVWLEALSKVFHLPLSQNTKDDLQLLEEKALQVDFVIEDFTSGAEGEDAGHNRVRNHLYYSLYDVSESLGGFAFGRDIVMRLRQNGFTPDAFFFKNKKLNTMYEYYLDKAAELVIEVTRPAHKIYDIHFKREQYARARVPEYIIVDPENKDVEFLRLVNGDYVRQMPDEDGLYRPQSVEGLAIDTQKFWLGKEYISFEKENNPFIVEQSQPSAKRQREVDNNLGWGELPFEPRIDLQPATISFEEYICWSPESKFEFGNGKIEICGNEGVRNLLGMLLMTFGLIEVCRFASPFDWVAALQRKLDMESREQTIRDEWRHRATKAAKILREKFNVKRIAITGDLASEQPLNYWSRPTIAIWNLKSEERYNIYKKLSPLGIHFIEGDDKLFQKNLSKGYVAIDEI